MNIDNLVKQIVDSGPDGFYQYFDKLNEQVAKYGLRLNFGHHFFGYKPKYESTTRNVGYTIETPEKFSKTLAKEVKGSAIFCTITGVVGSTVQHWTLLKNGKYLNFTGQVLKDTAKTVSLGALKAGGNTVVKKGMSMLNVGKTLGKAGLGEILLVVEMGFSIGKGIYDHEIWRGVKDASTAGVAFAGFIAGAKAGGTAGTFGGPWGIAIGGMIGGIGGSLFSVWGGGKIYNKFAGKSHINVQNNNQDLQNISNFFANYNLPQTLQDEISAMSKAYAILAEKCGTVNV